MKNVRQSEILNIVRTRDIDTQEQLLEELRARGFTTTQATISRDIKELRLVKELTGSGGYRYALSERKTASTSDTRLRNIFKEGVISVDVARTLWWCAPCPAWPQPPAPPWTTWKSKGWSERWPATTPASLSCGTTLWPSSSAVRSTSC